MKRIYLDTNVLVAYYAPDEAEEGKRALVVGALAVFERLGESELCISMWTVTEMVNTLVKAKKMQRGAVAEISNELQRRKRLGNHKVTFLQVSPQRNYDFDDFFCDVGDGVVKHRSHLADAIHRLIMRNNGITHVLTFDEKVDPKDDPGLIVLHPRDIRLPVEP